MREIDPGHEYLLDSYDGGESVRLVFMKREGESYPFNVGHHPGTNCQEVLRALIARVKYLNRQIPSPYNWMVLCSLRMALLRFEQRAAVRHGRTELPNYSAEDVEIELMPTCRGCGHIGCEGNHKASPPSDSADSVPAEITSVPALSGLGNTSEWQKVAALRTAALNLVRVLSPIDWHYVFNAPNMRSDNSSRIIDAMQSLERQLEWNTRTAPVVTEGEEDVALHFESLIGRFALEPTGDVCHSIVRAILSALTAARTEAYQRGLEDAAQLAGTKRRTREAINGNGADIAAAIAREIRAKAQKGLEDK